MSILIFVIIGTIPESILIGFDLWGHWLEYVFGTVTVVYFVLGLIVLIDFISLGGIRKIDDRTVEKLYAPIYKFYGYLTLSFLYRPLLYNFLDNRYTKRLFFVSFPYFLILIIYPFLFESNIHPHLCSDDQLVGEGLIIQKAWYADLLDQSLIGKSDNEVAQIKYDNRKVIVLSSYTLESDALSFFMRIYENDRTLLNKKYNIQQVFKGGWRFALFGDNMAEDSIKIGIDDQYMDKYLDLHQEYIAFRDELKATTSIDTVQKHKLELFRDSIATRIDSLQQEKIDAKHDYIINRNKKILSSLTGVLKVGIDTLDLTPHLVCKHAYHDDFNERGLHCDIINVQLPVGNHTIEFQRAWYNTRKRDSLDWRTYKLPVLIKEKLK